MHAILSCIEQDIFFGVFQNKYEMTKSTMQVVKDVKRITFTFSKKLIFIAYAFYVARED